MKEKIGWLIDFVEVKKITIISNIWMKIPISSKLTMMMAFPKISLYYNNKCQLTYFDLSTFLEDSSNETIVFSQCPSAEKPSYGGQWKFEKPESKPSFLQHHSK